ncbi:MAG TPA: murein transglycosylase domain-containing protein [Candidatus Methylomirabilis sp.]|nr:murein transglycosylase domain-containing protein [Candidatus Methylomirabilis sp.]
MWTRRLTKLLLLLAIAILGGSCATTKTIPQNVQRVVAGQPVDNEGMKRALEQDKKEIQAEVQQMRRKLEEAFAKLSTAVQQHWGQKDVKVPSKTVYVKYSQHYRTRVVTDFDHGLITIETLEDKDPNGSLKNAIVAALLTTSDPASVDLFSDKDVTLEPSREPYLYRLVLDSQNRPIRTREQAEQYARTLVPQRVKTRNIQSEEGVKIARLVEIRMVSNFEAKGADRYRGTVDRYSRQYQVSSSLVLAIMRTESNFNPFAVSRAPAYGLMQLVPTSGGRAAYRRAKGVDQTPTPEYLFDPDHNIELGTAYLSVLSNNEFHTVSSQNSRDYCVTAAYNTGVGNVTRTFSKDRNEALRMINGLQPPVVYERLRTELPHEETRLYIVRVMNYRKLYADMGTGAQGTNR